MIKTSKAKILAPAGDKYSFLAAIAAEADAIYCGFKNFSARMEADNFSIDELSRLNALARSKNIQVYVAFNSLVKQNEIEKTARIIAKLTKYVRPHALIIQDPGLVEIARRSGFKGELHLSTLGNCSFSTGLQSAEKAGFSRVVLPRELSIDEMKLVAQNKPSGVDLEVFVHGALCYAVSGRCYWSSWFGGRSGLRGRCVQPCRRIYKQQSRLQQQTDSKFQSQPQSKNWAYLRLKAKNQPESKMQSNSERFFSCLDFSADVLVKVLKDIPEITTWKIEGRKKSPHYVFYTVKAYKMLRDHGHDPAQKKIALSFLDYALGRPATHYNLLTQNQINPLNKDKDMETGSGLFAGRIKYGGETLKPNTPYVITREALLQDDLLRIGYEDDTFHTIQRVTRPVPKKGRFVIQNSKSGKFKKGAPVFIVDRREKEIWQLINELENELDKYSSPNVRPQEIDVKFALHSDCTEESEKYSTRVPAKYSGIVLYGYGDESRVKTAIKSGNHSKTVSAGGLWLSQSSIKRCSPKIVKDIWWFLPPVVWPINEKDFLQSVAYVLDSGAKNFVLNMPWQISCFKQIIENYGEEESIKIAERRNSVYFGHHNNIDKNKRNKTHINALNIWAGPFCNVANTAYIEFLRQFGFSGAFVSPELGQDDFFSIVKKSSLPLGIVVQGNWPLAISRTISENIVLDKLFSSPRGEESWISKRDNDYWIFPNWQIDLSHKQEALKQAGYALFLTIDESVPKGMTMKQRPGLWNWEIGLL